MTIDEQIDILTARSVDFFRGVVKEEAGKSGPGAGLAD